MADGIKRNACTLKVFTVLGVGWGRSQLNVKAIQIIPELKRKFYIINQCYLFSVSTVPPANMFGVEALYPD